jgi:hypothetical protein
MEKQTINWNRLLVDWQEKYDCKTYKSVKPEVVRRAEVELKMSGELVSFYQSCNGLVLEWFTVLPIEDPTDIKHTWDGLTRANDPRKSRFIDDEEFLKRFLIFAALDAGRCAVIDRNDNSIWYEEGDLFHRFTSDLAAFIEIALKEVTEL